MASTGTQSCVWAPAISSSQSKSLPGTTDALWNWTRNNENKRAFDSMANHPLSNRFGGVWVGVSLYGEGRGPQVDRQNYRQTDITEIITFLPFWRVVKKQNKPDFHGAWEEIVYPFPLISPKRPTRSIHEQYSINLPVRVFCCRWCISQACNLKVLLLCPVVACILLLSPVPSHSLHLK